MRTDRIYLTGFMGSGKSTVAPRLARGLGYDMIDLDQEISRHTGLSIPAIFELYGEQRFRDEERAMLHSSGMQERTVVSLGGGTLVDPANLAWCLEHGALVYLRASAAFLASRLAASKRDRPLLFDADGQQLTSDALRKRVADLLASRRPVYEQAHITIDIDAVPVAKVVKRIREELANVG